MAWLRRGYVNIHYQWTEAKQPGGKEVIVLIHGAGLDMNTWCDLIPLLNENYSILCYDLRGHGKSDAGIDERTLNILCEDLKFLLEKLNIHSYHLVAHGFGGLIAIKLAYEQEEKLKTLSLLAVPIHYPRVLGEEIVTKRKEQLRGKETLLPLAEKLVEKICFPLTAEKKRRLLDAYRQVSPEVYFEIFKTDDLHHCAIMLQEISVPILLLSGAEDEIYPPMLFCASVNYNYDARYYIVPHASFMVQMDQPHQVAQWLLEFIASPMNKKKKELFNSKYQKDLTLQMYLEIYEQINQDHPENILQVNVMKGFSVVLNGIPLFEGWGKRKAKQLLVYLSMKESVTRDQICDLLWPEVELESARNRLRVSLHYLKKLLEMNVKRESPAILVTDREHVFLQGQVQSDLRDYLEKVRAAHHLQDQVAKAELYSYLLEGSVENAIPGFYEEWFLNIQTTLEKEWGRMALFLSQYYEQQKDLNQADYYQEMVKRYLVF